jgi:dihydropyrimidinase
METLLLKNAEIINSDNHYRSDILIGNGKIINIGNDLEKIDSSTEIIDAEPFYTFPGGIDPHVHLELPVGDLTSADDFESGSIAALYGGTTTIIDFVTPERNQPLLSAFRIRKKQAEKSFCDYALHMSITGYNFNTKNEMKECIEREGITSFKTYMAYRRTIGISDDELLKTMEAARELKALITIHCENNDIISYLQEKYLKQNKYSPKFHPLSRPAVAESEAVNRAISMAKVTGTAIYLVHISAGESIKYIKEAGESGQIIFTETCPHYLLLDDGEYEREFTESANYVMSPPLRKKQDQSCLWDSLNSDIMDSIGTDHCPFNFIDRKRGMIDFTRIPNGVPGIEHRLNLLYTYGILQNRISLNRFVELTSSNAAKIFGLYPNKGVIRIGADADIVLWNKDTESVISCKTHHQKCDSNIYENFNIKGNAEIVISGGKKIIDSNGFSEKGKGKYLFRKCIGYGTD